VVYRWLRPVLLLALAAIAVYIGISIFVSLYTSSAWFSAVGYHQVFTTRLRAQIVLFLGVGLANRLCIPAMTPARRTWARRYRRYLHRRRRALLLLAAVVTFVKTGLTAAANWQLLLQWEHAQPFHQQDPQFHRDASYFVFVYPFHRYVAGAALGVVEVAIGTAVVVALVCGVLHWRGLRQLPAPLLALFSVLLGLLYVVKAGAYWLDRLALATTSHGVVTGPSYTDIRALLPMKFVLFVLALVAAAALIANAFLRRSWVAPAVVGGMIVAGVVLGGVVPAVVQRLAEKPNAQAAERGPIQRNIAATRYAFGLSSDGATNPVPLTETGAPADPTATAGSLQARVVDPNLVPPTFTQLQQFRSIYGFKSTLDVDHYLINGKQQDVIIAPRELTLGSLSSNQQTWPNQHLVYTHGYGVVAALLDRVDRQGEPSFVESGLPPTGSLGGFEPRVYFGQSSPAYSIVDGPGHDRELDLPGVGAAGSQVKTTYQGKGGVPIGSLIRQLAYAWKFSDPNIFLSSQVGSGSKLLYLRDPRARVRAVAPWLTVDGDEYPVVAGGRMLWVVDGYTTSNSYPDSQHQSLRNATTNTFTYNGASVPQSGRVNYIRNDVKAVVDAYDGTVTLYEWGPVDPVLKTWEKAFPGLVRPQRGIPAALLPHLRYPMDLFSLQRQVLSRYHISDPAAFYNGSDYWVIPSDPTVRANVTQPPYYTTYDDGTGATAYRLTASFTTLGRPRLAAYMSVDAEPGANYGHMTVIQAAGAAAAEGPGQIQNDIESDPTVAQQLTLLRGGNSRVVLGNLQSIPVNGSMLYIEPVYEQAGGGISFPILRFVIASYHHHISFATTLAAALQNVLK
jgi:uncharacterized membrane protein (UPF0182 family)